MRLLIFEKSNSYLNYAAFHLLFYSLFFSHFFSEFYVISLDFFEFVFHFIPPSSILITVAFYFDNSSLFVSLPIHKNNFFEFTLIPILENALHLYKVSVNRMSSDGVSKDYISYYLSYYVKTRRYF